MDIGTFSITGRPLLRPWGYSYEIPGTLINRLCDGWSVLLGLLSLFLVWRYYVLVSDRKKKRQAKSITVGIGGPILIGILSEIAMPVFGLRIPELTSAGMMWLAFFVGHAIWKYELFTLNPALVGENIIAMMNEMFFLLSPEGAIIRTNRKSQDISGYEEGEFAGRPLAVFMNDEAASRALLDRLRDEGTVENVEILLRTKSGGEIPAVFSGAAIRDRNPVIMGMVGDLPGHLGPQEDRGGAARPVPARRADRPLQPAGFPDPGQASTEGLCPDGEGHGAPLCGCGRP